MLIHLINLDRRPDRLAEFKSVNDHLDDVCRFSAVDGGTLDRSALIRDGIIEGGIAETYKSGELGRALSHISLWDKAIATSQILTICEDDAIFNRHFVQSTATIFDMVPPDWELILWGWNSDSLLAFELVPGVSHCVTTFDQDRMKAAISNFQRQPMSPQWFRLLQAFGAVCYSVSPKGARRLKALCLPIRKMDIYFPIVNRSLRNIGIDIAMSDAYSKISAFVCFPPLVVTKNQRGPVAS